MNIPLLLRAGWLVAFLAPLALTAQSALAPGEVLIERAMLPDARAGSFAFGLPGGVNFCYDPFRHPQIYFLGISFVVLFTVYLMARLFLF